MEWWIPCIFAIDFLNVKKKLSLRSALEGGVEAKGLSDPDSTTSQNTFIGNFNGNLNNLRKI